jgi:hypothetical protein
VALTGPKILSFSNKNMREKCAKPGILKTWLYGRELGNWALVAKEKYLYVYWKSI